MSEDQSTVCAAEAVQFYSHAIAETPTHAPLYGNRSASYLALGHKHEAYVDALKGTQLNPQWAKGCYRCATGMLHSVLLAQARESACVYRTIHRRLGAACMALYEYGAAAEALNRGMLLDGSNKDMAAKLKEAHARAKYGQDCRRAHAGFQQRDLVLKLRAVILAPSLTLILFFFAWAASTAGWKCPNACFNQVRRRELQESMERQFKQSMTAPDWELEDYEWWATP